jgi:hypothetical protein
VQEDSVLQDASCVERDAEVILGLLKNWHPNGLSMDELSIHTSWSWRTVNNALCYLRPRINVRVARGARNKKVTLYSIKE